MEGKRRGKPRNKNSLITKEGGKKKKGGGEGGPRNPPKVGVFRKAEITSLVELPARRREEEV